MSSRTSIETAPDVLRKKARASRPGLDAHARQEVPYSLVAEVLQPDRGAAYEPPSRVRVKFEQDARQLPRSDLKCVTLNEVTTNFAPTLSTFDRACEPTAPVRHRSRPFDAATAALRLP